MSKKNFARDVKVGLFVLIGIVIAGVVVFLIGDERNMFSRKVNYTVRFRDVQGLTHGAPVRLNGVNVGVVRSVGHTDDLGDPLIHVELSIVRSEALRLRKDAQVRVANKGLLGDKMIELTPGESGVPLGLGGVLTGEEPTDFSNIVGQAGSIINRTNVVLGNLETLTGSLGEQAVQEDLKGSIKNLNLVLGHLAQGKGYAARVLRDPNEAERLGRVLDSLEQTSDELGLVAMETRKVVARVNHGPGLAHGLIYDEQGAGALQGVGNAANELATTLQQVRQGDGLAKGLLFGGDKSSAEVFTNLSHASSDLRDIMTGLKQGKGTLGALLVDPSVYDDLKTVLGSVERNRVLRALVRYSIQKDEKDGVKVQPAPAGSP